MSYFESGKALHQGIQEFQRSHEQTFTELLWPSGVDRLLSRPWICAKNKLSKDSRTSNASSMTRIRTSFSIEASRERKSEEDGTLRGALHYFSNFPIRTGRNLQQSGILKQLDFRKIRSGKSLKRLHFRSEVTLGSQKLVCYFFQFPHLKISVLQK